MVSMCRGRSELSNETLLASVAQAVLMLYVTKVSQFLAAIFRHKKHYYHYFWLKIVQNEYLADFLSKHGQIFEF
jgi:hypothetical protein